MVVLGFSNVEVASKLHVTEATVKSHLSSAYRKLGVRSRHEATDLILSDQAPGARDPDVVWRARARLSRGERVRGAVSVRTHRIAEPSAAHVQRSDRPRTSPLLVLRGVSKSWRDGPGTVLDSIDLDIRPGTVVTLVGANGVGKTTFLRVVAGLIMADSGTVSVAGLTARSGATRIPATRRFPTGRAERALCAVLGAGPPRVLGQDRVRSDDRTGGSDRAEPAFVRARVARDAACRPALDGAATAAPACSDLSPRAAARAARRARDEPRCRRHRRCFEAQSRRRRLAEARRSGALRRRTMSPSTPDSGFVLADGKVWAQ